MTAAQQQWIRACGGLAGIPPGKRPFCPGRHKPRARYTQPWACDRLQGELAVRSMWANAAPAVTTPASATTMVSRSRTTDGYRLRNAALAPGVPIRAFCGCIVAKGAPGNRLALAGAFWLTATRRRSGAG